MHHASCLSSTRRLRPSPSRWAGVLLAFSFGAASCTSTTIDESSEPSTTTEVVGADEASESILDDDAVLPDLEVALVWHQHQPRYPVVDGVVSRPWVRLHAAKDYVDMATLVEEFPDLRLTINLTPVLLDQLEELTTGARDAYWVVSETPVGNLTEEQRQFVVDRFFDVNSRVIDTFPRYVELREKRAAGQEFSDQDLVDLRVLFNLAWLDPEMPEHETLLRSVGGRTNARDFSQRDIDDLLAAHQRLVAEVIPTHARLWDDGQIEVITTPLTHPILPLIADTSLAQVGDPAALLPTDPFREYLDAADQVELGLARAAELLGRRPNGMWPGEGAVAQAIMPIFAERGVAWVATGEDVLAQSLGIGSFGRDENETVLDPGLLYRPYTVETRDGPVSMVFRDNRISDLIGFEYSGMAAEEAAADLIARLSAIRTSLALAPGPDFSPLVTIILDGENAWENYPNDGRDFLRALYDALTSTEWLTTTTPSRYLDEHPTGTGSLERVFPAAWFSPDFATWIGENEELRAWELLRMTRLSLRSAEQSGDLSEAELARATRTMYEAEGSDWFWWYGADQDSGNDRYFDDAYRELLGQVHDQIGEPRPRWVDVPIIPDPAIDPQQVTGEPVTIEIDGNPSDWEKATLYRHLEAVDDLFELGIAIDESQLALRIDGTLGRGFEIYLGTPRGQSRRGTTIDDRLLGFDASHLIRYDDIDGACVSSPLLPVTRTDIYPRRCTPVASALSEAGLEIGVPLSELGPLAPGDRLYVRVATPTALNPSAGAIAVRVPDIAGFEPIVSFDDASGDDTGPGSYVYPTDQVFTPGSFDLVSFETGFSGEEAVFSFELAGPVNNPWGSPTGLAIQTFDVYIDVDPGAGTGRLELLDGRNAAVTDGNGWEAAITVEGWDSAVATAAADGSYSESSPTLGISVLAEQGRVTVRVPLSALPDGYDPATAGFAVAVLGQEGFPSSGVRRVRDVAPTAAQYEFGGGDSAAGDTRVIDALDPAGDQRDQLAGNIMPLAVAEP